MTFDEVHLVPAELKELALTEAGPESEEDHRAPVRIRGFNEVRGLGEVEKIEFGVQCFQESVARHGRDAAIFAGS